MFHGQAPPSTTGWKVQNPPSAGVLRRARSMAMAWACSRVSGAAASPASSSPGLALPGPDPEPLVGQRGRPAGVADLAREQGHGCALGAGRRPAAPGGEAVQGLALPCGEHVVELLGDADRRVVVADLGLVVPEHRQAAVAADAV